VIGSLEPEIYTKMLKNLNEKLRTKLPATTPSCSNVKIDRLDDSSLDIFLTPSKLGRRPITPTKRKADEKKERGKKNSKVEKPQNFDFCAYLSRNVLKRNSSGKNS